MSAEEGAAAAPADFPLFYRDPRLLDSQRHAKAGLKEGVGLGFARATNSVSIAADEFFHAQAHYPIVFTSGNAAVPVVVMGLADGANLFVGEDGKWRPDAYVPAYIRRYPFVFVERGDQFTLAIDEAAEAYSAEGGRPFFNGSEPTPQTQQAVQFCSAFHQQGKRAREFGAALLERDLLTERRAEFRVADRSSTLTGFRVIDEKKFEELPDEIALDWRRRGWLALAYAHLMSMLRWPALSALAAEGKLN